MGFTHNPKAPEFQSNMNFKLDPTVRSFLPAHTQQRLPSNTGTSVHPLRAEIIEARNSRFSAKRWPVVDEQQREATGARLQIPKPKDNNEKIQSTFPVIVCSTSWLEAQKRKEVRRPESQTPKAMRVNSKRNTELWTGQVRYRFTRSQGCYGYRPQIPPVTEFRDLAKIFDMEPFIYRSFLKEVLEEDRELADKRRPLPAMPDTAKGKQNTIFGTCFPDILDLRPEVLLSQHRISHHTSKRSKGQKKITQTFDHEWITIYREIWNRRCVDRYRALCNILGPGKIDMIEKNWQRGHFHQYEHYEQAKRENQNIHVPEQFLTDRKEAIVRKMQSLPTIGAVRNEEREHLLVCRYYCIMRSFYIMPALLYPDEETTAGLF
ncbi:hypothetical protein EV426DRAFT_644015 [Tirmania nivea]|nr:hypothetical protein EV426DRAFT_644015 [Tirmania nivea]